MEADALKAMFGHIESLNILPAWFPNISQDNSGNKEPTDSHFRVFVLPVDTDNSIAVCGSKARYKWLLQVSVYVRDGVGQIKAAEYIDLLRNSTKANTELYTTTPLYPNYGLFPDFDLYANDGGRVFKVLGVGNTAPAIHADGWFHYPVTFTIEIIE